MLDLSRDTPLELTPPFVTSRRTHDEVQCLTSRVLSSNSPHGVNMDVKLRHWPTRYFATGRTGRALRAQLHRDSVNTSGLLSRLCSKNVDKEWRELRWHVVAGTATDKTAVNVTWLLHRRIVTSTSLIYSLPREHMYVWLNSLNWCTIDLHRKSCQCRTNTCWCLELIRRHGSIKCSTNYNIPALVLSVAINAMLWNDNYLNRWSPKQPIT